MTSRVQKLVVLLSLTAVVVLAHSAMAQQITYYNFDGAVGTSGFNCTNPPGQTPLLCFNDMTGANGQGTYPQFQPGVIYPDSSSHNDLLMNPSEGGHSETAWFAVPQRVVNGFTSYFAFRLSQTSNPPADGIAFVVQNAQGGHTPDTDTGCQERPGSSGPTVVTVGGGGCIGYSGIDNSLAVEFDTYTNQYDPGASNNGGSADGTSANHIAIQSCGSATNSSSHYSAGNVPNPCLLAINSGLGTTLADGNVHEVVVEYSGSLGATPNVLKVFVDPTFVAGTHTPVAGSVPVISATYDFAQHLSLLNGDSAYVGFTAATGANFEQQEILSWTFTPHTPVTQGQPLQPGGTQTTFPFGAHTYAVTYPSGGPDTSGIDMVVTANTVKPTDFGTLIGGTPFAGSQCQIYDGTGGNCVIYSVHCVNHGTTTKVDCPSTSEPTIALKTAYESDNSITPVSPGYLQGDPFFSGISSITSDGTTATASCIGECSITVTPPATTQSVTIAGNSVSGFNGSFNANRTGIDTFTFPNSTPATSGTGGYVTSNNVSNICNPAGDPVPCWQAAKIDGTTSGKTKNFSDFVALSNTVNTVGTNISISAPSVPYGTAASILVTVTPASGSATPTGNVSLSVDNSLTPLIQTLTSGSATFSVSGLAGGSHPLTATYTPLAQSNFLSSNTTGSVLVTTIAPTVSFTGAPSNALYQSTFAVTATTSASVLPTITGTAGVCSVGTVGGTAASASATVTMLSGTGTCTLTATWVADTNYRGTFLQQTTNATKPTPVISWTPASVQLGYPLTAAQLDATANVPGAFTYNPPLGTVVGTTSQSVTALFTPSVPANYNTATATVNLTVTAGPIALVSPTSIDFGILYQGSVSTRNVTVTNTGNAAMTITTPFISLLRGGNSNEFAEVNQCPKSLAPGKSCTMTVGFAAGPYYTPQTAVLNVMDNAPGNPQVVMITATVINPQATLSTNSLSFGNQTVGTMSASKTVTLKNTGATALSITGLRVTGANPGDFLATSACPSSLNAGSSCSIGVVFKPTSKTSRSATLTISDNAQNSPQTVALSGQGK